MRKIILYFALKYNGNYQLMFEAIKNKEQVPQYLLENIEDKIRCNYVTILDSNYPNCLKVIGTPPLILFYYGDLSLLNYNQITAIIGTRKYSVYGKEMTEKIVAELKEYDSITISGLALGIDAIAHQQSLKSNIKTIAVLGGGIDYCYPISNMDIYNKIKKEGLIISEYPNDIIPEPKNFLIRNRLIAAIANNIVVIEANYKSGTMNTVAYALEFGKNIYCVPYLANKNSGCNHLIKQGANLIEAAKDIFE